MVSSVLQFFPPVVSGLILVGFLFQMRGRPYLALHVLFVLLVVSIGAFTLTKAINIDGGPVSALLVLLGGATCGWSWLFGRALFSPPSAYSPRWPLVIVGLLVATTAFLQLIGAGVTETGLVADAVRMAANINDLASSTVLMLVLIEALGVNLAAFSDKERRFRVVFSATYAVMVAIAVLWVGGAGEGSLAARLGDDIRAFASLFAVLGATACLYYRERNPLPKVEGKPRQKRVVPSDEEAALGDRILGLMRERAVFADPDLKVADLARQLNAQDYKVTRAITGPLGFSNFNQMVNHFRIERAKQMLRDPSFDDQSILSIAMECGFGSIGPFNRAFKSAVETTPGRFRRDREGLSGMPAAVPAS
ncbi:MAG: AraC family transcriptional regulator [Pseudomonadota bacterium]